MFVYVIVNAETLKLYVGQHKGQNLRKYLQDKQSRAKAERGERSHLYASMRRYPKEAWSIHPLMSDLPTREEVDYWEKFYIKALKAQHPEVGYNICRGGEGRTGPLTPHMTRRLREGYAAHFGMGHGPNRGKKHTDEWKQQASIRARQYRPTEEVKQRTSATLMGHDVSDAVREHARELGKRQVGEKNPFFGQHHSEESKRKNSEAHQKPWSAARRAAYETKRVSIR